ncbi:type IV secretory system conjugative DNA transfer family protein [Chamaesiphon sp.]|uniref:type IV secretory system conjugative DNA transfer family protein n=1 Tax=Chamaesiphon sp. TaxID=2814140 RepID=UPI003593C39D
MKSVNQVSFIPPPLLKTTNLDPSFLAIFGLGLLFIILSVIQGRNGTKGKTATARWANPGEIQRCHRLAKSAIRKRKFDCAAYYITEPIGVPVSSPSQVLGRKSGVKIVFPEINRGLFTCGATGCGKTDNIINPCLHSAIAQGMSIALFDGKGRGGQAETLIPLALRHGYEVRVLAPGDQISNTFNTFDSIKDERDVAGARERVAVLIDNTSEKDTKKDSFFDPAGSSVLSGAFLMAKWVAKVEGDPLLANILMVNQILKLQNLSRRLQASQATIDPWIYSEFGILTATSKKASQNSPEGSILATAIKMLAPLVIPNYLQTFCGKTTFPGFDPQDPLKVDGKQMVVFMLDPDNVASTVPLIAMAIHQVISYNLRSGRQEPMVVSLDEFHLLNLPIVLKWLAVDRYNGSSIMIGTQYLSQLDAIYGKDRARGFLTNCNTKAWFNPGDPDTEQALSKAFGEEELELKSNSKSYNFGKNSGNSRSENEQLHKKPLIEAHIIGQLPKGKCIIQSPGTGNKDSVSIPFVHQFSYDEKQSKAFKKQSLEDYSAIREFIINERGGTSQVDFSQELLRYTQILERLLPLTPETEAANDRLVIPDPLHVVGADILNLCQAAGFDLSKYEIAAQKKYYVPTDLKANGDIKSPLTYQDVTRLLEYSESQHEQPPSPIPAATGAIF